MNKLIPLTEIPSRARGFERAARAAHTTPAVALQTARYEIVEAPGTYSGKFPKSLGWCCSAAAADALASASVVHMPGHTSHRTLAVSDAGAQ